MIKIVAAVVTGAIILLAGCYNDKEELLYGNITCDGSNASYAANVSPIIQKSCAVKDCHAAGSINGPGPLTNYNQIRNAAVSIQSAVVSRFMPQGSSLTLSQIKSINCWVTAGAPNN